MKIVIFTAVKNRCILHGRVFVMDYGFVPNEDSHHENKSV